MKKTQLIKILDSLAELLHVVLIILLFLVVENLCTRIKALEEQKPIVDTIYIECKTPKFVLSTDPKEGLGDALCYYNIQHKDIVYAQAILETGHFKSNVCKNYNNLFGLYNSRLKDYYKFNHWVESVIAYTKYIQYRYKPPEDYYKFLERIGYAEDPLYIDKLKRIVSGIQTYK
jgi:hypothetical protein